MTGAVDFLAQARARDASDLYVGADKRPFVRVEGEFVSLGDVVPADAAESFVRACCKLGDVELEHDVDFCFDHPEHGRFRANLHHHVPGWGLSLKCVPSAIPTLDELGLPETLHEVTWYRTGMVLVTGPAGCGKTSTLAALIREINKTRREHIVTIEDPIEFVFASDGCNVTQREVGSHTQSFDNALRSALREDPDVILVSELRGLDAIRTAVVAAETGHLVLGTLHTRDAASTVNRLLDVFPPSEQDQIRAMLATSLRTVVSQFLLPRAGGGRRVPAYEIMHVNPAIAKMIRDGRTHQIAGQLQTGRRLGMIDLDSRLLQMVEEGLIERDTATEYLTNAARLRDGR